jgi:hypothetical protein
MADISDMDLLARAWHKMYRPRAHRQRGVGCPSVVGIAGGHMAKATPLVMEDSSAIVELPVIDEPNVMEVPVPSMPFDPFGHEAQVIFC